MLPVAAAADLRRHATLRHFRRLPTDHSSRRRSDYHAACSSFIPYAFRRHHSMGAPSTLPRHCHFDHCAASEAFLHFNIFRLQNAVIAFITAFFDAAISSQ